MDSKKNPTAYPDRPAIIKAARAGDESLLGRLTDEDRLLFFLYRDFPFAGKPMLASTPEALVARAMAVSGADRQPSLLRRLAGVLTFDSWAGLPAVGTRSTVVDERRLRFAADDLTLDIRAEHRRGSWQFTAKVYGQAADTEAPTLIAGEVEVSAGTDGFYHWISPTPPVRISLKSPTYLIELAEISWQPHSHN